MQGFGEADEGNPGKLCQAIEALFIVDLYKFNKNRRKTFTI